MVTSFIILPHTLFLSLPFYIYISLSLSIYLYHLGQKKLNISFSGTSLITFNSPHQKFLFTFQDEDIPDYNHFGAQNVVFVCDFLLLSLFYMITVLHMHFQHFMKSFLILNAWYVLKFLLYTNIFSIKNKNKKPPSLIIFRKKVPEKLIINFSWPK